MIMVTVIIFIIVIVNVFVMVTDIVIVIVIAIPKKTIVFKDHLKTCLFRKACFYKYQLVGH